MTFTGTRVDTSTVSATAPVDGDTSTFQTFLFDSNDFSNLISVSWNQGSSGLHFDNLVITSGGAIATDVALDVNGDVVLTPSSGFPDDDQLFTYTASDGDLSSGEASVLVSGVDGSTLTGTDGDETLIAGSGDDTLIGGMGNDYLVGGDGDDAFVFSDGDGADTIHDFSTGDTIELMGITGINEFADVSASPSGDDTVIDLGDGNSITLLGVDLADLGENDFLFA